MTFITTSNYDKSQGGEASERTQSRGYSRDSETVRRVQELSTLPPKRMVAVCCENGADVVKRLPEEILVALCRHLQRSGESAHAWTLAMELARRCRRKVTHSLRFWRLDGEESNPADSMDEVLTRLYESVFDASAKSEFWEIRFWVCFDRCLLNVIRRKRFEMDQFATGKPNRNEEDDNELVHEDRQSTSEFSLDDPFMHAAIADALSRLPEAMRTAYILKHVAKMPEESGTGNDVETISGVLGVSGRTVRNYLNRAEAVLSLWRGDQVKRQAIDVG